MKSRSARSLTRRQALKTGIAGLGAVAAGISFGRSAHAAEDPELNFYNWDTYIGETTLDDFKGVSGIEVNMSLFADNDELFAKLKEGNPGFDLIVPTNDFVERMAQAEMIVPLDHSKIPNFEKNISSLFKDPAFDPGRKFSMPYMWGTMGIGYRKSRVKEPITSWKTMFDSDEYSGRISWLSESRTMLGIAGMYMGHGMNAVDPVLVNSAADMLIAQKPHVRVIAEDNGQDLLLSGEVDLAIEWNGDILQVMEEDDDIGYVIPQEGSLVWEDTLCIPKDAPHPLNAHAFINYILEPEAGAKIAEFIFYASPNTAARALLGDDYNKNPAIFPPDEIIAKCEPSIYLGEDLQRAYEEAWTRMQAA
ncbi:MAG: spermidine/putrescine ABC transporter substrate-binding protein [Alphaproteobacteria bacterium]|nr:spermidine/putrescine ABC transporter substrate-binding protein [Alphaproteobacteria bacterium]